MTVRWRSGNLIVVLLLQGMISWFVIVVDLCVDLWHILVNDVGVMCLSR